MLKQVIGVARTLWEVYMLKWKVMAHKTLKKEGTRSHGHQEGSKERKA